MRYLLLMSGLRVNLEAYPTRLTPAEMAAHLAYVHGITRELEASGELVVFEELTLPSEAKLVRGAVTHDADTAFTDSKEFVGALWLIDCDTEKRALAIAERLSVAPGRDGAPTNIPVEVRPTLRP